MNAVTARAAETSAASSASTAIAVAPRTKLDVFVGNVLPPHRKAEIAKALPAHVPIDRFERNLINALMAAPKLMDCDARLVYREVSKIAALGLLMDPQLGEAYLIVGYSKGANVPQSRIGYRGLIKLARQSGEISTLSAHEVRANDHIDCELGLNKRLVHKPDLFGADRGPVVGYYAVVTFKDGSHDFEAMNRSEVEAIRDNSSDGWKAFKAGRIKSTPWSTAPDEMAKKTVLRRLMKRLPQSPDLAKAWEMEDADRGMEVVGSGPARPADRVNAMIAGPQNDDPPPDDDYGTDDDEAIDGEIIEPGGASPAAGVDGSGGDSTSQSAAASVPASPAKNWTVNAVGQDAIIKGAHDLLGMTETAADIDALVVANEDRIAKWPAGVKASWARAIEARRAEIGS